MEGVGGGRENERRWGWKRRSWLDGADHIPRDCPCRTLLRHPAVSPTTHHPLSFPGRWHTVFLTNTVGGTWGKAEEQRSSGCRRQSRIVQAELHGHAGWAKKKLDKQERKEDDTYCKEGLAQTVGEGYEYEQSQTWVRQYLQKLLSFSLFL